MTTAKTIALTRWTIIGKVMSLLFNMLSRMVITFLPRSKHLLISWLQSPSAVILEPRKIKSVTGSIVSPFICHEMMGPDAMILVLWLLSFKPTFSFTSSVGEFPFLHTLSSNIIFRLSYDIDSGQCKVVPFCSFDSHFSNNEQCWASFPVFISHLYVVFREMSV